MFSAYSLRLHPKQRMGNAAQAKPASYMRHLQYAGLENSKYRSIGPMPALSAFERLLVEEEKEQLVNERLAATLNRTEPRWLEEVFDSYF
jgi:hypothetical protein